MNQSKIPIVSSKITLQHLGRLAYIYIRQSTVRQVERNRESQRYQCQLVQRATALGWSEERTRVIDADLGLSGRGSDYRDGFQALVAEVSLAHVGIIFGYEVSRLARNNRDWYHLLDLAAVFGTLIADVDGVYDPRLYNDRLLLGLKGTMSEAELHLLRIRLGAGRMSQVERGVYRQGLPTGLVRLPDKTVVKDPDQQVQHTIELVLHKFAELGSCRQVLLYLQREQILLPRRHSVGQLAGQLFWKPATPDALSSIIHSPAYAGAFAYGRRQMDSAHHQPQRPSTGLRRRPMAEWQHLQQDVYPAYITWEQYLKNRQRLAENSTLFAANSPNRRGPARTGAALLQGLAVCGLCGARMRVAYKATQRYECANLANRVNGKICASLHGVAIDQAVVSAFFEALRPAQLDALEEVLKRQADEDQQLTWHWQEQRQRAEYEARLAQRQYEAVDPDHRLVASELERRWEEKLRELRQVEESYTRFQQRPPAIAITPEQRAQFQDLSETLPGLWENGAISTDQQKELLRCIVSRVILKRVEPEIVEVRIVWVSGHYSLTKARMPAHKNSPLSVSEPMIKRIEQLWHEGVDSDRTMAAILTAEGFYTARSPEVGPTAVQKIRLAHGWYYSLYQSRDADFVRGYLTAREVAAKIGVEKSWVHKQIHSGEIDKAYTKQLPHSKMWLIKDDPQLIASLKQLLPAKLKSTDASKSSDERHHTELKTEAAIRTKGESKSAPSQNQQRPPESNLNGENRASGKKRSTKRKIILKRRK